MTTIVDVPSGRVATVPGTAEKLRLNNPAYLSEITVDEATGPEDVERSIGEVEAKQVRYILWSPYNVPDARHPLADHLGALRTYLDTHYHRVQVFSDREEIWER